MCGGICPHTSTGGGPPQTPSSSCSEKAACRAPNTQRSIAFWLPLRWLQPKSGFGGHPSTFASSHYLPCQFQISPCQPPQTLSLLMSVYLLISRKYFLSLNWSVICSMLFLSMICHLTYLFVGNTGLRVLKHQFHKLSCS